MGRLTGYTQTGDTITYDNLDRLTGATPPLAVQQNPANPSGLPIEQYTYDPVHNRKSSAHQPGAWTYNENNELQAYGNGPDEQTYAYDANGNTIEQKSGDPQNPSRDRVFLYAASGRLIEVQDNGVTVARYQYDPMGRRIRKETTAGVGLFQYADEGLVVEYMSDGAPSKTYGWRLGSLWGSDPLWLADVSGAGWIVGLYHNDHLGTSQRVTAISGVTNWTMESEAFGRNIIPASSQGNSLRFPGQFYDNEDSLHYNFNRTYDPSIGRYIGADPLGTRAGLQFYGYVKQRPLLEIDARGLAGQTYNFPPGTGYANDAKAALESAIRTLEQCKDCMRCPLAAQRGHVPSEYCISKVKKEDLIRKLKYEVDIEFHETGEVNERSNESACSTWQGSLVWISRGAFEGEKCCPLDALIAHEAGHMIGLFHEAIFYYEEACFHCGSRGPTK